MELSNSVERVLQKIDNHLTQPKKHPSHYITVSTKTSSIQTIFSPPIIFPPGCSYEMACCSVETYYSFPNIDESNNKVKVSCDEGKNWTVLEIPKGCYEIKAINKTLKRLVKEKVVGGKEDALCLMPNKNTLQSILILKEKVQIDFRGVSGTLRTVLGFDEDLLKGIGRHESEHIVNIMRVNSIIINCDVIQMSRMNGIAMPIIYDFFPNVSPGQKIVSRPRNLIYLPLTLNVISQLTVWVTDQNGSELDLRGEELTITFHIKAC